MIIVDEVSLPSRWKQRNWRHANQKKRRKEKKKRRLRNPRKILKFEQNTQRGVFSGWSTETNKLNKKYNTRQAAPHTHTKKGGGGRIIQQHLSRVSQVVIIKLGVISCKEMPRVRGRRRRHQHTQQRVAFPPNEKRKKNYLYLCVSERDSGKKEKNEKRHEKKITPS